MRNVGSVWETAVENHLQKSGLRLIGRNFTSRYGEIGLVMRERDCMGLVEVSY